jgi:hypothetical protein
MEKKIAYIVELWFDVLALHMLLHFLPDALSFLYSLNWVHISIKATTNIKGSMFSFNSKENTFLCTSGSFSWIFFTSWDVI